MSPSPAVISFSSTYSPSGDKDTVRNIRATKGFTVNIISEPWIQQANMCCINSSYNVSEWPMSGLRKEPSVSPISHSLLYIGSCLVSSGASYRSMSKLHASRKAHFLWNARYINLKNVYFHLCFNTRLSCSRISTSSILLLKLSPQH